MPTSNYIWDGNDYLVETDEDGTTTALYTNEPGRYGKLIMQHRGTTASFFHFTGQGSTDQLSNDQEAITDTRIYNAAGEVLATDGSTSFPFAFLGEHGYFYNEDEKQYYVRNRNYDPGITRWRSPDPLGFGNGTNLYAYTRNNFTMTIDPSGLFFMCPWGWTAGVTGVGPIYYTANNAPMSIGLSIDASFYFCFGSVRGCFWQGVCAAGSVTIHPSSIGFMASAGGGNSVMINFLNPNMNKPGEGFGMGSGIGAGAAIPNILVTPEVTAEINNNWTITVSSTVGLGWGAYVTARLSFYCAACNPGIIAKLTKCLNQAMAVIAQIVNFLLILDPADLVPGNVYSAPGIKVRPYRRPVPGIPSFVTKHTDK